MEEIQLTRQLAPGNAPTGKLYLYAGTDGYLHIKNESGTDIPLGFHSGNANLLINGAFGVNQRNATTAATGVYGLDRWYTATDATTNTITQQAGQENIQPYNIRLTQPDASAKYMGLAQIIEGKDCKRLRGQTVTLSLRARASAAQTVRFAVLEWTGTEDAVTRNFVSSWGNPPTYIANVIATSFSFTPAAATWTSSPALSVTLGTTFNNLIVFVWTETAVAQNFTLELGLVQLEQGATATAFQRRHYAEELALCMR